MSLEFGPFELDTDRRLLLETGAEIHISKKAYELLRVLMERAPKAVSKQDLLDLVWPDTFVSDTTMPGVIAELRNVLSDDAREPRYIRTVHGFGYAFASKPRFSSVATSPAGKHGARLLVRGREIFLSEGDNVIGRDPETAISIDDLSVSRRHACIHVSAGTATLEDLGSKNGTLHNGKPVAEAIRLNDRDVITAGSITIVYRESRTAGTTMTIRPE